MEAVIVLNSRSIKEGKSRYNSILKESIRNADCIIFVDGGFQNDLYRTALNAGAKDIHFVGDFDSFDHTVPVGVLVHRLPKEKDISDFHHSLYTVFEKHHEVLKEEESTITIFNFFGGRMSMSLANLQDLNNIVRKFDIKHCIIKTYSYTDNLLTYAVLLQGQQSYSLDFDDMKTKVFSVIALSDHPTSVQIKDVKYEYDGMISSLFPLGISNELIPDYSGEVINKSKFNVLIIKEDFD